MKNEKVIEEFKAYLLEQDKESVAYLAASLMLDMNRIYCIDKLPNDERKCLLERVKHNAYEIQEFVKKRPTTYLRLIKMNSTKGENI